MFSHQFNRVFKPEQLQAPRDFEKPQLTLPVILEIGAGKGHHALQLARQTQKQVVAVERTRTKFGAFSKQSATAQLDNLLPVHADAIAWCVHALPPASVSHLFLLYPNPEGSNPNQRWHRMPFFEFLLSRLSDCAGLTLATNIHGYAKECQADLEDVWGLQSQLSQVPSDSTRTAFETKYLARSEVCWQVDASKPAGYKTRFD